MNFKQVLEWVRRHVFIVVFGAIIIAAPIAGWIVGSSLKQGVVDSLNTKRGDLEKLNGLEKTTVTVNIPGSEPITQTMIVNRQVIDEYGRMVETLGKDAEAVRLAALKHNSKNRDVLVREIFPKPSDAIRIEAHERLYPALVDAYERLLDDIRAGEPPPAKEVRDQLARRSATFISGVGARKQVRSDLSPDERQRLDDELLKARKGIYADVARQISLYATAEDVGMPPRIPASKVPSGGVPLDQLFEWNWQFWIAEDVLRGLAAANAGTPNVITAPVKRVVQLKVLPIARSDKGGAAGAAPGAGMGASAEGEAPPAEGGAPVDSKSEVQLAFANTFTGRVSNPLYDVRTVSLRIIASTTGMPAIADALAQRNFITITNVSMHPADPFEAARAGYLYGAEPVSDVLLTLEIIQLREWTTVRMPAEMKSRIGTQGIVESTGEGTGTAASGA